VSDQALATLAAPAAIGSGSSQNLPAKSETAHVFLALPHEIVVDLLRRGDAMLAIGDISSARLLYLRAAESGDARATTQLGKSYDPLFLAAIGAWGVRADVATAAKWYRKAIALGDAEAAKQLKQLGEAGQ
jgi:TPR repeat protein